MITKEQLTDALEQGLSVILNGRKIQIVAIIMDVVAVKSLDSDKIIWLHLDSFFKGECIIEQPKPKYNGRAVKCDTVEQANFVIKYIGSNYKLFNNNCINLETGGYACEDFFIAKNYEIISFSQYCQENNITEPKWIQGFEIKNGYNDVVMVSDDEVNWNSRILIGIRYDYSPFITNDASIWRYCRYPNKNEINEIKFAD